MVPTIKPVSYSQTWTLLRGRVARRSGGWSEQRTQIARVALRGAIARVSQDDGPAAAAGSFSL